MWTNLMRVAMLICLVPASAQDEDVKEKNCQSVCYSYDAVASHCRVEAACYAYKGDAQEECEDYCSRSYHRCLDVCEDDYQKLLDVCNSLCVDPSVPLWMCQMTCFQNLILNQYGVLQPDLVNIPNFNANGSPEEKDWDDDMFDKRGIVSSDDDTWDSWDVDFFGDDK